VDDPTLADLEHENFVAAGMAIAAGVPGSLVRLDGGIALIATGLPIRFFNQVVVVAPSPDAEALRTAVDAVRERHSRFVVLLRRGIDSALVPDMATLGLVESSSSGPMPGMALHPLPDVPPTLTGPEDHEIRLVADLAGLVDHRGTAAAGFGMPDAVADMAMHDGLLERADCAIYVGYSAGMPVTTGLAIRTGRTIGVYNIATIEAARRRGLGSLMTARITADGRANGCDVAILQASEMGLSIYERLGYRTVVEYDGYVEPEGEPSTEPT
jgi:GNAT superfamily N-acetyltransferase